MKMEAAPGTNKVEVAGLGLELWRAGRGRPLVFLHPGDGLDDSAPVVARLAEHYEVIAPSHPGFGGSDLPKKFTTVDDLAYFYLDFLEGQNLKDAVLLGVSFGAWIAAEIIVKSSAQLSGLILASALGAKFEGPRKREIADLFSIPQYEQPQYLYQNAALQNKDYASLPEETLLKLARNFESFARFGWSPTLHNPKLADRLHRIHLPTLVISGENDRVVPSSYGRSFAQRIPGASFKIIEGAGHYAHVERPDAFVSAVDTFVNALPKSNKPN